VIQKGVKIGIGIGLVAILASAQLNPGFLPMEKPNCLEDNFFEWTKDLNIQLRDLPNVNKTITILLGMCMDALALTCFYKWISDLNRSWTFPLALCSIYALKILIHVIPNS
jgi:hypothetical protein